MEEIAARRRRGGGIKGAFGSVGAAFNRVFSHIGAIVAVLAGGAVFGKGIEPTKELTGEASSCRRRSASTTQAAPILNVALRSIGSSADVYADANAKLVRQVRTNEGAVNAMGVATRGANGQLLDGKQMMDNALKTLASTRKAPTATWPASSCSARARRKCARCSSCSTSTWPPRREGGSAGPGSRARAGRANVKAYKEAMEDVHLVVDAMQNTIGQSAMPRLTQLAQWFAGTGPDRRAGVPRSAFRAV
jgi:hypothetical protein